MFQIINCEFDGYMTAYDEFGIRISNTTFYNSKIEYVEKTIKLFSLPYTTHIEVVLIYF